MIVSIGMLAWDEETGIAQTIQSLFQQSVFSSHPQGLHVAHWELIIVPNGCSDATATVASEALALCLSNLPIKNVTGSVIELSEAGKSNAWNHYIHDFSRRDADIFVMVDSDIEFDHPDTILNSIQLLIDNPQCSVVVDTPLKDFTKKQRRTFFEELSLKCSNETFTRDTGIAGSFYCSRTQTLRNVWMPKGLSGEDGFLRAMIVTDCFRSAVAPSRVARAENASHFYEGLTQPKAIFKHELRMVIGTALNCYFTWDFLKFATDPKGAGAGHLIRNCLEHDPDWYKTYIQNEIKNRGWWVLPRGMLFRRFSGFRDFPLRKKLKRMPFASLTFLFDLLVFLVANRRLKKSGAIGFW